MSEIVISPSEVAEDSSIGKQLKSEGIIGKKPDDTPPPPSPPEPPKPTEPPPAPPKDDTPPVSPVDTEKVKQEYQKEWLKDTFGADVDFETAKKIVEAAKQLPTLSEQLAEAKKNQTLFANDYVKGLNDFVAKGGSKDTYDKIQGFDFTKPPSIEDIKILYKTKYPQLTDAQIELKLNKKYSQGEDYEQDEKELGLVDIAVDSQEARKELETIKQKESIPDTERQRLESEKVEQQRVAAWQPEIKKMVDGVQGVDLVLETDDKGNPTKTFQYKVSNPELKKFLLEDVGNILEAWDVQATPETVKDMAEVVNQRILLREHKNIVKAIWNEAVTDITKQFRDKYHVGDAPPSGDKPPAGEKETNADELFKKQMEYARGR